MHIKIAIKRLVEFVLRQGSIDSRFTSSDRALLGSRIHRKLQKEAKNSSRLWGYPRKMAKLRAIPEV